MAGYLSNKSGRPSGLMVVDAFLIPIVDDKILANANNKKFFEPIYFQFLPELGGDDESANYDDIGGDIIGRAEGFSIYKNGSNREITLKTQFAAWDADTFNELWVLQQVYRLKALTKPIYERDSLYNNQDKVYYAPPLCLFSYGNRYVNIPVVITDVSATNNEESSITEIDALASVMDVEITMKTNYPYGYVPGYLDYSKIYDVTPNNTGDRHAPSHMSWKGSNLNSPTISLPDISFGFNSNPRSIESHIRITDV
jgi:hypothetical protein